jgi:hypothetical protein
VDEQIIASVLDHVGHVDDVHDQLSQAKPGTLELTRLKVLNSRVVAPVQRDVTLPKADTLRQLPLRFC